MHPQHFITTGNQRALPISRRVPFTHMGPVDTRIWQAALALGLMPAESYEYDVRLGGVAALGIDPEHHLREMWETLLRKRIDVIAWRNGVAWIIEVKPVASFAALGQCLGYGDMWKREKPKGQLVRLACVCAVRDPDLVPTYQRLGVEVVSLPESVALEVLSPRQAK